GISVIATGNIITFLFRICIIIIGYAVYRIFKNNEKNVNRQIAATGEDLEKVRRAVRNFLPPDAQDAQIVYAHWEDMQQSYEYEEDVQYVRRRTRTTYTTTYYRYAVAFKGKALWVFLLKIDKNTHDVEIGMPRMLTPERLGKIQVTTKEKNGVIQRVETTLVDKQGGIIVRMCVDAENLNSNKYLPVNILQENECTAFKRFIIPLAHKVEAENPGIDRLIGKKVAGVRSIVSVGLSISGLLLDIFVPISGMGVCLLGLMLAIDGKNRGNPGNKALITSWVCVAISVAHTIFFCFQFI
ncbi:MAG: hypothetical protein K2O11_09630, partial [Oscillospiraceae bacterium]|nr:hypothetical protein [Oscillospiraceae bacterium]